VAARRQTAGFVGGGLRFGMVPDPDAVFRPWLDLGRRYQWNGHAGMAMAGYAGGPITLLAYGGERAATLGWLRTGVEWRILPGVALFATGTIEAAGHQSREALQGGVRLAF
jgi:hypothetical protein